MKDEVKVSPEEILARIHKIQNTGAEVLMPTEVDDLIVRLPFEMALPFLKEGTKEEEFKSATATLHPPLQTCNEYLEFAWSKANDCRALSAMRSLQHIRAWLFLAGFGDVVEQHFGNSYEHYGKKQLVIASLLCGFDWTKHDDKEWRNHELTTPVSPAKMVRLQQEAYRAVEHALSTRGN